LKIEEGNILYKIEISNYMKYVQLSKQRRAKFFKKGQKIPKKYLHNEDFFNFNSKGILVNVTDDSKVIANPRVAGTPRMKKIRGNDIWSGMDPFLRAKIAKDVKNYFKDIYKKNNLKMLKSTDYPIGVYLEFHDIINEDTQDIDNLSLVYRKCSLDALKSVVIEDDMPNYVQEIPCSFIPIDNENNNKLIITIYKI